MKNKKNRKQQTEQAQIKHEQPSTKEEIKEGYSDPVSFFIILFIIASIIGITVRFLNHEFSYLPHTFHQEK